MFLLKSLKHKQMQIKIAIPLEFRAIIIAIYANELLMCTQYL